jgi:hypothetical protein
MRLSIKNKRFDPWKHQTFRQSKTSDFPQDQTRPFSQVDIKLAVIITAFSRFCQSGIANAGRKKGSLSSKARQGEKSARIF